MKRLLLLLLLIVSSARATECADQVSTGLAMYYLNFGEESAPGRPWTYYDAIVSNIANDVDTLTTYQKPGSRVFGYVHMGFVKITGGGPVVTAIRDTLCTSDDLYFKDGSNNRIAIVNPDTQQPTWYHLRFTQANADSIASAMETRAPAWDTSTLGFYFDDCFGDDSTASPVIAKIPAHRLSALQITNPDSIVAENTRFKAFRDRLIADTRAWVSDAIVIANIGNDMFYDSNLDGITVENTHTGGPGSPDDIIAAFAQYLAGWNVCWDCFLPGSLHGCQEENCGVQEAWPLRDPMLDY